MKQSSTLLRTAKVCAIILACVLGFNTKSQAQDVFPDSVDIRLVPGATPDKLLIQIYLHSTDRKSVV